ncbi:MAG: galactokinase [Lachnospiraceae bacterium]|nr:galactokinase [Lachnospiraceae bacterium]
MSESIKQRLLDEFANVFGDAEGVEVYFAPGRVNLIGEHTDYNGGHVFPCALTIGTYGAARKRNDKKLRFYSVNFEAFGVVESTVENLVYDKDASWTNYPKGVMWAFEQKGMKVECGMDLVIYGNIPNSSGLSSSASVEVLTGTILRDFYGFEVSNQDIALISQFAENQFNGVNCGIMDQFAIAMGKKDCAIFLDTATLEYEYVPLKLDNAKIVIACTNKKRGLGDSKYNERRSECEEALAELQKELEVKTLGDLSEEQFEDNKALIQSKVRQRRVKHAVYENVRTVKAVEALQNQDISLFGELMNASHKSLAEDYEVTGVELDTAVEAAWQQKGVIGARMTGAGFGGCSVSIVQEDCIDEFVKNVGEIYLEKIGYAADFYVVGVGDGPMKL